MSRQGSCTFNSITYVALLVVYVCSDVAGFTMSECKWPLLEDLILREFPPIAPALHSVCFGGDETLSVIQEVPIDAINYVSRVVTCPTNLVLLHPDKLLPQLQN